MPVAERYTSLDGTLLSDAHEIVNSNRKNELKDRILLG